MPLLTVSQAAPHELLPACRLLFKDGAEQRRDLLLATSEPTGLFVARDSGGKLRAAALMQALPGALGVAWPTRGDSRETEDAATAAACDWLRERGVKVCQAFASVSEAADMAPLERSGFRHVTQLVFLRRDLRSRTPEVPESALEWSDEGRPLSEEFRRVLLATHEGTQDCPELNGARTPEELLAGFEAPPRVGGLSLYREAGESVGVVICAEDAAADSVELTYIGVVPEHRGRRVASRMLAENLRGACYGGFTAVTLSVDARNTPARRLYAWHGFVEHERREVWLASWPA